MGLPNDLLGQAQIALSALRNERTVSLDQADGKVSFSGAVVWRVVLLTEERIVEEGRFLLLLFLVLSRSNLLDNRLQFDVAVQIGTCPSRHDMPHDDIFLEANKRIHFPECGSICQHTCGVLK